MASFTAAQSENQIAFRAEFYVSSAVDFESNTTRVCSRRNYEIVLEMTFFAVVNKINSRINTGVAHLAKMRNSRTPLRPIVPGQIVTMSFESCFPVQNSLRIRSLQAHAKTFDGLSFEPNTRVDSWALRYKA